MYITFTPLLSWMLRSAPLPTRDFKLSSQQPSPAAMCTGVHCWRKETTKIIEQVSVQADFTHADGDPTADGGIHPLRVVFNWIKHFVGQPKALELESLNLTKLLADLYKIGLLIPFEIDYLCRTLGMLVTQKTNYKNILSVHTLTCLPQHCLCYWYLFLYQQGISLSSHEIL